MQLSRRNLSKGKRSVRNKGAERLTDVARSSKLGITNRGWFR